MSRRERSEWAANAHLARPDRARKLRDQRRGPTWSLKVTTVAKVVGALLAVLAILDLAGVL